MRVVKTIPDLRAARATLGQSVGVVLTMGALHAGHLALVRAARADHDHVLATIFVNPTQFTPGEDFARYPRPIERDLDLLRDHGVDLVFTPTPDVMYPPGFQTHITVDGVTQGLEGAARPGHFMGVATVVAKFFNLTQPATTYFGQKDAQQVVVVRRMVRDLDFPLAVAVIPTEREPDGLAMSSRNVYLTPDQRQGATALRRALLAAGAAYETGERDPAALREAALAALHDCGGEVEYVSLNDPRTLAPVDRPTEAPLLLSLVVRYGRTRLLDNGLLPASLNTRAGLSAALGGE
ncbi:MAG: pantoate--beta-alanine ligase [Anaerolineae bacterium]|nr:pantoate--beta-alanine ligase [Anaerolineae bacterium]